MPPNKMMLGIGTYGRGDTPAMPYTGFKGESGFVAYYEVEIVFLKSNEIKNLIRVVFKLSVKK